MGPVLGSRDAGLQSALPAEEMGARPFRPSGPLALALRLALIGLFVAAVVHALTMPVERQVGHLLTNLSDGNVESITIERPSTNIQGQMQLRVDWTQASGRDGYAYYEYSSLPDQPGLDDGATILTAAQTSPAPVDVTVHEGIIDRSGITWNLLGLAWFGALLVLILGPQPRLATKWAWFWLGWAVPPVLLAFLVLEPVPVWRRESLPLRSRRFTGGLAFLAAIVLGGLWQSLNLF